MDENKNGEPELGWSFLEPDRASVDRITRAALTVRRSVGTGVAWKRPALVLLFVVVVVAGLAAARHGWQQTKWSLDAGDVRQTEAPAVARVPEVADYGAFMRLSPDERRRAFDQFDSTRKADMARAHAVGWLRSNRNRLDSFEAAGIQAVIDFISPRLYGDRADQIARRSELEFSRSLRCVVRPETVSAALDLFDRHSVPPPSNSWSYFDRARCWVGRLADSAIDCAELRVCRI